LSALKYYGEDTIIELKNASKSGKVALVLKQLSNMQQHIVRFRPDEQDQTIFYQLMVECIFVPDVEERTALYYASLTGHDHIVELFLSLYIMSAIKVTESNIGTTRTFREWFFSLKGTNNMIFSKMFTKKDYDLCVLNSLNDQVRHVLTKKKVTILDAMNIAFVPVDSVHARIQVVKKELDTITRYLRVKNSKSKKKPILVNDIFNGNDKYESDDLWTEEDYYEEVSEEDNSDKDTTINTIYEAYIHDKINISEQDCANDVSIRNEESTCEDISIAISHSIDEEYPNEKSTNSNFSLISFSIMDDRNVTEFEDLVTDSITDYSIISSATSIDCSKLSLVPANSDDKNGEFAQDWDVMSDLPSVNSLNTFSTASAGKVKSPLSVSYRDIVKKRKPIEACDETNKLLTLAVPAIKLVSMEDLKSKTVEKDEIMTTIAEEDDMTYDAHWERNGYKNGRGGKLESTFKGNNRTPISFRRFSWDYEKYQKNPERRNIRKTCRGMIK